MSPKDLHRNNEHFLARFFEPESVAIVGASNNPMRITYHLVTDLLEQEGLRLAETGSATPDKLRPIFPAWDIPANPWDLGLTMQFHGPGSIYPTVVDAMVAEPNVDALANQIHPETLQFPKELMGCFLRAPEAGKPIALWLAAMESGKHENLMWLEEKGVPVYSVAALNLA